ncbi:MAG: hypothetical protein PWQ84_1006 [Thermotogaceae bacterium]|jgi:16S rRNA G966 N2-methylase RsmD|nr:hypothetical protein [Thermotogaceae bacterium]
MNLTKEFLKDIGKKRYATIYADPPWQFKNRTGLIFSKKQESY